MAKQPTRKSSKKSVIKKTLKKKSGLLRLTGIQQGVGHVARRAFGANRSSGRGCFDATLPAHLPLPIATGPYTVIRVTQLVSSNAALMGFGSFRGSRMTLTTPAITPQIETNQEGWAPYVAFGGTNLAANPVNGTRFYRLKGLSQLGPQATVVPSAITVQIMNPNALQTTNGILYMGRMKTQFRGEDDVSSWGDLANEFVAYQAPRLCSAGKLALRGVKIDACPFNMKELQDFDRIIDPAAGVDPLPEYETFPWASQSQAAGSTAVNPRFMMKGFAPILIYNPNTVNIQYLVTMELRCRFDIGHPASSTHTHHNPASAADWSHHVKSMLDCGHGVVDIVESVAAAGEVAGRVAPLLGI